MSELSAYLLLNASGQVAHASQEVEALVGVPSRALLGLPLEAHLTLPPRCACGTLSSLATDGVHSHDVFAARQGEAGAALRMHIEPLLGEPPQWLVRLTPRDQPTDASLLQSLTACPTLHWTQLDRRLRIVRGSEAFARRFGEEGALRGRGILEVFPSPALERTLREAIETQSPRETHALHVDPTSACGARRSYWNVAVQPSLHRDACVGALVYLAEVTEACELNRTLSEKSRLMAELLMNAPDGICIATPERVLFRNHTLERLLGPLERTAELNERVRAVDGRSLEWFALARPEPDWLVPVECVADEGRDRKELHVYVRPITFEEQPAILYAMRDHTAERRLERQLLRSHKLEALGRISTSVSHDLGNLLTLLAFDAEQARRAEAPEALVELHDSVARTTERAQRLVREVLDFTRDEHGETLADLTDSVRKLQPILERSFGSDRALQFRLSEGPLVTPLAAIHVEQILLNLLMNARDATRPGDAIQVTLRTAETGGAEIHVRDFGVGMTEMVAAQVFEPFFTTKRDSGGAGMGLSLVRDVVQRAGGRVRVESRPGAGAHFVVQLPLATSPTLETTTDGPVHGNETVAICYPDEQLRAAMTRWLRLLGYTAVDCSNCPKLTADAWICDARMLSEGEALGTGDGAPLPPTLCITESPAEALERAERSELCVNVLAKPFTPLELARALRRTLD